MSILALTTNTLTSPAAAGQIEYNGQFFGTDSAASRAQMQRITQGTAVASTSGTSIDFTGIPAWVKKITVMFSGVSLSGTSSFLIQLGDAGGFEITAYVSLSTIAASSVTTASNTTGFLVTAGTAARSSQGIMQICSLGSNTWVEGGNFNDGVGNTSSSSGTKTLSDTLTQVRITTVNGTDTFDAGSINIMYEG
jgi:hypothetical protein